MDNLLMYFLALYIFFSLSFIFYAFERYSKAKNTENLYDRAYAFRSRDYRIYDHRIELYAPKRKSHSDYKSPLLDSLSEYSKTFPNLCAMMKSTITIMSFDSVWFHMDACLQYPFHGINAADVRLCDRLGGLLCSSIDSNPIIENITFPRSMRQLNVEICYCEQLKSISLPRADQVVEICFADTQYPIEAVHPTFCFHVPPELLTVYRQKYKNIPIRYTDGKTGFLRFYPIGQSPSDSSEVYPESKASAKYLMTAANGMQVWVPEDKLEQWEKAQADQSDEAKQARAALTAAILKKMEQLTSDSPVDPLDQNQPAEGDTDAGQDGAHEEKPTAEHNTSDHHPTSAPQINVQTKKKKYCKKCGNLIGPATNRCTHCLKQYFMFGNKWFILFLVTAILFAMAAIFGFKSYKNCKSLTAQLGIITSERDSLQEQLEKNLSELASANRNLRSLNSTIDSQNGEIVHWQKISDQYRTALDFYEKNVYFIVASDFTYYHRSGCHNTWTMAKISEGYTSIDEESYRVCDRQYAISHGYIACPDCVQ